MDILDIIVNNQWQTQQVGYHYTRLEPINPATGLGRIWEMKSNAPPFPGWPADVIQYDANWIYFFVTEDDDTLHDTPQPPGWNHSTPWSNRFDPTCYKMQVGVPGKGMRVLPRNVPALPWISYNRRVGSSGIPHRRAGEERRKNTQYPNADTAYNHAVKCSYQQVKNLRDELEVFDGPFDISWAGNLGICPTYVLTRVYTAGKNRERYYYPQRSDGTSYGWAGWDVATLVNGVFQVTNTSYRNNLVNAAPPIPQNPCKF